MAQKYKVFLEEKVIYFTNIELIGINNIRNTRVNDYQSLFNEIELENQFLSNNPQRDLFNFFQNFKFIEAAGGIVQHENEFLFIQRNGFWDIPKGKMEKNESPEMSAIREIQEECGLTGDLEIQKKLIDTYHTYKFKNKSVLKKTHWYLLDYMGDLATRPQLEEGITEVVWFNKSQFGQIKACTYASIHSVLLSLNDDNLD